MQAVRQFITDKGAFCLVVALVEPHVPWVMGDKSQYPPKQLKLPPNIADTPMTRDAFGRYLAEITYMDSQVGELLQTLAISGKANNTLVLFTSEQGSQFPGCKWTNWDTGLHTALMARWPGRIQPGRTDAIVQYADVLPTLLDLASDAKGQRFESPQGLDGKSFADVLRGKSNSHREFAFGVHNNLPEGPSYPIRTVTDGEHRYIRNLKPEEIYIERHLMGLRGAGVLNNPLLGHVDLVSSRQPTHIRSGQTLYATSRRTALSYGDRPLRDEQSGERSRGSQNQSEAVRSTRRVAASSERSRRTSRHTSGAACRAPRQAPLRRSPPSAS